MVSREFFKVVKLHSSLIGLVQFLSSLKNSPVHVFPNCTLNHTIGVLSWKFALQFTMSLTRSSIRMSGTGETPVKQLKHDAL
jgi:hypothetical protein